MASTIQEVQAWAADYDSKLRATDKRFERSVLVIHVEGSVFNIMSAFLIEYDKEWVVMFSEHQGYHVWCAEDLSGMAQFAFRGAPDKIKVSARAKAPPAKRGKARAG